MCSIMGRVIFLLPLYLIQREDYNGFWCCRSDGGVLAKNSRDKIIWKEQQETKSREQCNLLVIALPLPPSFSLTLSVCLSLPLSACLTLPLSFFLSVSLICVYISVCMSVSPPSLSLSLSLSLNVYINVYIPPSIRPSLCVHRVHSLSSPWPSAVTSTRWASVCRRRSTRATRQRRTSSWNCSGAKRQWR